MAVDSFRTIVAAMEWPMLSAHVHHLSLLADSVADLGAIARRPIAPVPLVSNLSVIAPNHLCITYSNLPRRSNQTRQANLLIPNYRYNPTQSAALTQGLSPRIHRMDKLTPRLRKIPPIARRLWSSPA